MPEGLENIPSAASQATHLIDVRYPFHMGLGLLLIALVQEVKKIDLAKYIFANKNSGAPKAELVVAYWHTRA